MYYPLFINHEQMDWYACNYRPVLLLACCFTKFDTSFLNLQCAWALCGLISAEDMF